MDRSKIYEHVTLWDIDQAIQEIETFLEDRAFDFQTYEKDKEVWNILKKDLPVLKKEVQKLLEEPI